MNARIYQPSKTAMQSGMSRTRGWVLEFISARAKVSDEVTGWVGGAETCEQVRLAFTTCEEAVAYAKAHGLAYQVLKPHRRKPRIKSYADNFRHDRVEAWTH